MDVVIAIHGKTGSFSDRWVERCSEMGVKFIVVNCMDNDIVRKISNVQGLLWHWAHSDPKDVLLARSLIKTAEIMGIKVFPNTSSCWHFDDKIAQKYLLEGIHAPVVPTYVFYDIDTALEWIDTAEFPKVFKLRRGAGSQNVKLVRCASEARALLRKSFGKGFRIVPSYMHDFATRKRISEKRKETIFTVLKRLPRTLANIRKANILFGRENGYIYFQEFIPDNLYDTRVTVIGNRAFAFTRDVRKGDFRASGSGSINYDLARIDSECIRIAFDTAAKVGSQSLAFDFVRNSSDECLITEISYCYQAKAVYDCLGYWDRNLEWHEGHVWPQDAILEDLLSEIRA